MSDPTVTPQDLLDLYFPDRTPAHLRSVEEDEAIANWLAAYHGDFEEMDEVTFQALDYYGCDQRDTCYGYYEPAYDPDCTSPNTETGTHITGTISQSVDDGSYTGGGGCTDQNLKIGFTSDVSDGYCWSSWFVFRNITIPDNSTINKAVITLTVKLDSSPSNVTLKSLIMTTCGDIDGVDCIDSPGFARVDLVEGTQLRLDWDVTNELYDDGDTIVSPDIACIIQERIDETDGWLDNDPFVILIDGSEGELTPYDYQQSSAKSAVLDIWYTANHIETPTGGVIAGGEADTGFILSVATTGGVTVGGESVPSVIYTVDVSGGVIAGGSARLGTTYDETVSGGVIAGGLSVTEEIDQTYIYTKKTAVIVPAGAVGSDLKKFLLTLSVEIPEALVGRPDEFYVTDDSENVLASYIRSYADDLLIIEVKTDLLSGTDNTFFIYHASEVV